MSEYKFAVSQEGRRASDSSISILEASPWRDEVRPLKRIELDKIRLVADVLLFLLGSPLHCRFCLPMIAWDVIFIVFLRRLRHWLMLYQAR